MENNKIETSEQTSQRITIGTQGNQDNVAGNTGSHHKQGGKDDIHIPNQDQSSATNQEKERSNQS